MPTPTPELPALTDEQINEILDANMKAGRFGVCDHTTFARAIESAVRTALARSVQSAIPNRQDNEQALAQQPTELLARISGLEKALGECSGALEAVGHPIDWVAQQPAAVAEPPAGLISAEDLIALSSRYAEACDDMARDGLDGKNPTAYREALLRADEAHRAISKNVRALYAAIPLPKPEAAMPADLDAENAAFEAWSLAHKMESCPFPDDPERIKRWGAHYDSYRRDGWMGRAAHACRNCMASDLTQLTERAK